MQEPKRKTRRREEKEAAQKRLAERARDTNMATPRASDLFGVSASSHSEVAALVTVPERIKYIALRMSEGAWLADYQTRAELGHLWGVCEQRVREYAAEAHRWVALLPEEQEHLRTCLVGTAQRLLASALADRNTLTGMLDIRGGVDTIKLVAMMAGIDLEQFRKPVAEAKVEIVVLSEREAEAKAEPASNTPSDTEHRD